MSKGARATEEYPPESELPPPQPFVFVTPKQVSDEAVKGTLGCMGHVLSPFPPSNTLIICSPHSLHLSLHLFPVVNARGTG